MHYYDEILPDGSALEFKTATGLDQARQDRQNAFYRGLLDELGHVDTSGLANAYVSTLDAKRDAAKAYLGANWIGHRGYQFNPRHSNNPDIYAPARKDYLKQVGHLAFVDRQRNPAFLRANQIRKALAVA